MRTATKALAETDMGLVIADDSHPVKPLLL